MSGIVRAGVLALLAVAVARSDSRPPNLNGTWHLDVAKSRWGTVRKPISVIVKVDHREPQLNYQGTIFWANDDDRPFSFSGAIDGKEYPLRGSSGEGKIVLRRVDSYTVLSTFKSDDGNVVENVNTTLSRDGKTMSRRIRVRDPQGERAWTEIYVRDPI